MPPAPRGSQSGMTHACPDCDKTFSRKEVRSLSSLPLHLRLHPMPAPALEVRRRETLASKDAFHRPQSSVR